MRSPLTNWEPDYGSWYVSQIIDILASHPEVWSKMALFIMYDEEGGPPPRGDVRLYQRGVTTAKRRSRNRISEVWSNNWEFTQPPRLQGDTTIIGTRMPNPYGPAGKSVVGYVVDPLKYSFVTGTFDFPGASVTAGVGGTRWSKWPSMSPRALNAADRR